MKARIFLAGIVFLGAAHLQACSHKGGGASSGAGGGSGATASGGTGGSASGGSTATGGSATGGSTATGGSARGGSTATGGKATGGATGSGGTASGGAPASGGASGSTAGSGGSTSGGKGGSSPTGGVAGTGGATASGGTRATGGSSGGSTSIPPTVDKPSTATTWSQNLTVGPNGPIPLIVVDQFGYRTSATKVAIIRDPQTGYDSGVSFTPGSQYTVVDKASGKTVKQGAPTAWNGGATDTASGDKVWWFDFSDVTTPGTYTVNDVDKKVRSVEFDIDDNIYRSALKHAVRMFYYQRAGFAKTAAYAGADWTDAASLLGKGQDSQAHAWLAKTDE